MAFSKNSNSPEIAFIIGMGRSGTTLLTNMFNSHPNIISTPENEFILFTYQSFFNKDFHKENVIDSFIDVFNYDFNSVLSIWKPTADLKNDLLDFPDKNFANACKSVYLNYPFAGKNKSDIQYVIDKNPVYSLYLKQLNLIYPKAKYIVLTRDFRDNVLSRKKYTNTTTSIFKLAASWNFYYDKIFKDIKKYNLNYRLVRYEDLVSNSTKTLKDICDFLEIDYMPNMLNFQGLSKKMNARIKENSSEEVYSKINLMHSNLEKEVNVNRVKAFENELTEKEISILNYVCSKYGKKFNYLNGNKIKVSKIKFSRRINNLVAKSSVSGFHFFKKLYYKLPVAVRLFILKKQK